MSWVYRQMSVGMNPREVLRQIIPHEALIPDLDDLTLWKLIINIMCEPPPRSKLSHINTMADVLQLMRTCNKIIVLTGAGVCVEMVLHKTAYAFVVRKRLHFPQHTFSWRNVKIVLILFLPRAFWQAGMVHHMLWELIGTAFLPESVPMSCHHIGFLEGIRNIFGKCIYPKYSYR